MLQAFVSESLKPFVHQVVTFGAGHLYMSQSDKGGLVFGGDLDGYKHLRPARKPAAGGRGDERDGRHVPSRSPACGLLRSWAGSRTCRWMAAPHHRHRPAARHVSQLRLVLRRLQRRRPAPAGVSPGRSRATNRIPSIAPFTLDRFQQGILIDEKGQGATTEMALRS